MGFDYRFALPTATKHVRSKKPFNKVKTEYWLLPLSTLVGNVGGTLGMVVGFSFIGISETLMRKVFGSNSEPLADQFFCKT